MNRIGIQNRSLLVIAVAVIALAAAILAASLTAHTGAAATGHLHSIAAAYAAGTTATPTGTDGPPWT
jgi:hypothetical protein